jgi:hypothetical protein
VPLCETSVAQGTGTILGTVHAPSDAVISGANIEIKSTQTGGIRTIQTDENGNYSSPLLPIGSYEVTAGARNFTTVVRTGIQLMVAQEARVDFELRVSQIREKIEVRGDAPLVDTQSSSLGGVETSKRLEELPLNNRDFYQLAVLQPGVIPPYANRGTIGTPEVSAGGIVSQPEVNGLRESNNYSLLDGAYINDAFFNTAAAVPNPDAIAEFKLQTNLTSARYGRGAGAVINVVTKSGTNQFHGTAYEFFRNNVFDASNYFVRGVPALQRSQFGANIGGPIKTNKSFFFVSYEGLRLKDGQAMSATVPSIANRQGDFSDLPLGSIIDPHTGQPFPGPTNFDPALINKQAQAILNLYPVPNNGPTTWSGAPIAHQTSDHALARWDQTLSARQTIGARYIFQRQTATKNFQGYAFSGPVDTPGFPTEDTAQTSNVVVWDTLAMKTTVNDARLSFQRNNNTFGHPISGITRTQYGFSYPQAGQQQFGDVFPQFGIAGYSSIGNADGDVYRLFSTVQLQDTLSSHHGRHDFAVGGEFNRQFMDSQAYAIRMGVYFFLGFSSGNPVADMLLGLPSLFSIAMGDPTKAFRSNGINGFFEDTYRVAPRFTLTLGMRYELQTAPIETSNRFGAYSSELAQKGVISPQYPEGPPGLVFAGDPGFPRSIIKTQYHNVGPRVGFAYDILGDGKTSLRGGLGIYYDQAPTLPYFDASFNPPQYPTWIYTPNPASTFAFSNPVATNPSIPQTQAQAEIPGKVIPPLPGIFAPGVNNTTPDVKQWNLSIQRAVTNNLGVTVAYVGNSATHLLGSFDQNQSIYEPGATPQNVQQRRPNPLVSNVYDHCTCFSSNYNALQVTLNKRMSHAIDLVAAYTWSNTIDYDSQAVTYYHIPGEAVFPQNTYDLQAERGPSAFDVPQRFVVSGNWQLPLFDRKSSGIQTLLNGWALSGIYSVQSGYPFTAVDSLNPSATAEYGPTDRPSLVGNPNSGPHTVARWFNTAAFQAVPLYDGFGDSPRNNVRGPGLQTMALSLLKNINLADRFRFQFRAECFNCFNHENFAVPINDIASPNFGQIIQTSADNRELQFAIKLIF